MLKVSSSASKVWITGRRNCAPLFQQKKKSIPHLELEVVIQVVPDTTIL